MRSTLARAVGPEKLATADRQVGQPRRGGPVMLHVSDDLCLSSCVAITPKLKRQLLSDARRGCCIHRRTWVQLMDADQNSRKHHPLDIHHVQFRSLGGSDLPENLVPLCPTCHRMLHDARRAGRRLMTDDDLRRAWQLWKDFRQLIPETISIGAGPCDTRARITLVVYGLSSTVAVDSRLRYAQFREVLIEKTVSTLRRADPYYPFRGNADTDSQWHLSSDTHARGDWPAVTAATVLGVQARVIALFAPQIIELSTAVDWRASIRRVHRRL